MEQEMVTPGEVLGIASEVKPGKGAYQAPHNNTVYASLTGFPLASIQILLQSIVSFSFTHQFLT